MSRSLASLLLVVACGVSGLTAAAQPRPQDFAYGIPIQTPIAATAYRFTVPVEVFNQAAHGDLRDVRIFNASGDVVPYELRPVSPSQIMPAQGPALPLYPLHGDAHATLNGVRITIHSQGTAVHLQTAKVSPDPHVITRYVLDARQITQPLSGLNLHWPDGAAEFSGSVRIESSDDLGDWTVVKSEAPVINLAASGSQLIQSRLEFQSTRANFWRLTWVGKTPPFELDAVMAAIAVDRPATPQSALVLGGSRATNKEGELTFDLGASLPVTQINLLLPDSNSVHKVALLSRAHATDPWREVIQGEFYRVGTGSSEHANEPMRIPTDTDRFWLARENQSAAPTDNLQLQVAWNAIELVFLAKGSGPYLLAYGNTSAPASSVALDPLIKGVTVAAARTGRSYNLGGIDRLRPAPKTLPWRMALLWAALALAVGILAWMAYRLSSELTPRE
jgi:uncharacterized protein DUF3999